MAEGVVKARQMLLKVPEAAELLRVSSGLVWQLIWRGELPSTRVGRFVRVYFTDVERYLDKNRRRIE